MTMIAQQPGTRTTQVGALLADVRLTSSAIDSPFLAQTPASPPKDLPRDGYETTSSQGDQAQRAGADSAPSDANPFASLSHGDAPDARLSGQSLDLDTPVETTPAQLTHLSGLLAGMIGAGKDIPPSLLDAFLMLAHDVQSTAPELASSDQQHFETYVQKLAANVATNADHKAFWQHVQSGDENVMALVQRVLRESYILSNGVMADMANQLKATNDLRKKIQQELGKARRTQAGWASKSKGDATWSSKTAYAAVRVNEDALRLEPDIMNADDLAEHEATIAAQQSNDDAARSPEAATQAITHLFDRPHLTSNDLLVLDDLGGDDGLVHDSDIKKNMKAICAAIPSMNADDLRKYIEPSLDHLNDGNTDEQAIFAIFQALSPAQLLIVVGDGYTCEKFGFGSADSLKFRSLTVARLIDFFGSSVAVGDIEADSYHSLLDHTESRHRQLTAGQALALINRFRSSDVEPSTTTADGATVGSQRQITTSAEMDAYIKSFEDELNSLGDDAQLLQIDLQDALQKNQQTMTMMSNLLKVVHDTAMAVVRNDNS